MNLAVPTLETIGSIDPSPFFIGSLIPYLFFLNFAKKCTSIPKISLLGYRLTLLFVFMTIVLAIVALIIFNEELTNIDPLHGLAEAFLTISDALVAYGFYTSFQKQQVKNS